MEASPCRRRLLFPASAEVFPAPGKSPPLPRQKMTTKDTFAVNIVGKTSVKNNDLKERDFNIDAIAWSQERGIIDPYAGRNDIEKRVIKAVRMKNLKDDPVRMLRAYRIAAELGFQIEENTRKYIKHHSKEITRAARERITDEFYTTLNNINS